MRKRAQIDNFNEMPKEKRPPENLIWWGTPEDIDAWFDRVTKHKGDPEYPIVMEIDESEIE